MTDFSKLKKGASMIFHRDLSKEVFDTYAKFGIECVELSFTAEDLFEKYKFHENAALYAEYAARAGVELWSLHLPFSYKLDISSLITEYRENAMSTNKTIINASAEAGIKTIVLHPSSEPIPDNERSARFEFSRKNIAVLAELCQKHSLNLAVENLPRTCLCNKSHEMIELLCGLDATVCFDTNHSLWEDNLVFLDNIIKGGLKISTLHISDYDFVDERHWLPGDGINNWCELAKILEKSNYDGPLMYEILNSNSKREIISFEELTKNQSALANKLL